MEQDILEKMINLSQGNPGGITVLSEIYQSYPIEFVKRLLDVLEKTEIRGPDIWVLWKNKSNKNYHEFIANVLALDKNQN